VKNCNNNEDCITNSCINNECSGRLVYCNVGSGEAFCGLDTGETCTKDSECLEKNCKNGICEKYDQSKDFNKLGFMVFFGTILFIYVYYHLIPKLIGKKKEKQ